MIVSVTVSVCLSVRDHIFELHALSSPIFVHVTYGRGSVLPWRRSDMLYTPVLWMTSYLLDVAAQLKRSAHTAFVLAIKNCAQ